MLHLSSSILLGMFGLGPMEIGIIAVLVLLFFGNRFPSAMRSLGMGITEFKKGVSGTEAEADKAAQAKLNDSTQSKSTQS